MTSTTVRATPIVELRTLGSLDIRTANGEELRALLAQPKRVALLCYLAIAAPRGFHRRDSLVGLFWPETDQRHARAALRQALHFLRHTIGADVVLSRGAEEIGLDFAALRCDVGEFERHVADGDPANAMRLYKGPLLQGFSVNDSPEFERWLDAERDRLARIYASTLETLAQNAAHQRDVSAAAEWWRRLAQHDPYSSPAAMELMLALDAAGDRTGAITHARSHIRLLREDLGVEADPEVMELAKRLQSEPVRSSGPRRRSIEWNGVDGSPAPTTSGAPGVQPRSRPLARGTAAVAFAALLAYWLYLGRPALTAIPEVSRPALAVLPFENVGEERDAYVASGIAEAIVSRLAGMRGLSVLGARDGGLGGSGGLAQLSGTELGVDYALSATVERVQLADGSVRIRVAPVLRRVADGTRLWNETFDEDASRIFDIQTHVVEEITRLLAVRPLRTERQWLSAAPTENLTAYDLYLQGNAFLSGDIHRSENFRTAVELYEQAVSLDTAFAAAYAQLSIAHTSMFWWEHDRSAERLAQAKAAADAAIKLRPELPISHVALGWYHYWGMLDYDLALRHFELARTSWPGDSDVLVLIGAIRRRQGDLEQALIHYGEAADLNPACEVCAAEKGYTHLMLRDYAAAEREANRSIALAPDFTYPRQVGALTRLSATGDAAAARRLLPPPDDHRVLLRIASGRWAPIVRILGGEYDSAVRELRLDDLVEDTAGYFMAKAELYERTGQAQRATGYYESARSVLETFRNQRPHDPLVHSALGITYAALGRKEDAIRAGTEGTRLRPLTLDAVDGPLAIEALARIYMMVGEPGAAIDKLDALLSMPSTMSVELLRLDPVWVPLRGEPQFQRLVQLGT